jgi:Bifunctional DNA primase/polymerase, N-terminal
VATVSRRDAAAWLASRGFAVFPCGTPGPGHDHPAGSDPDCEACKAEKAPRRGWKWKERYASDPQVVAAHWPADDPNIGIACLPSRLVVVDLDTPAHGAVMPPEWTAKGGVNEGADVLAYLAEQAGQDFPFETYTVRTGSGGWHLYFKTIPGRPIPNSAGKVGPMVDVRGDGNTNGTPGGGYVLGPGSVVGGARYELIHDADPLPLPGWIADLADPPAPAAVPIRAPQATAQGGVRPFSRFTGLLDTLLNAPKGQRNNVLHWAACRAAEMVRDGHVERTAATSALAQAGTSIGLGDREVHTTIGSAFGSALGRTA